MKEIIFLGTGPARNVRRRTETRLNSSILFKYDKFNLLVDCTPNFLEQIKKNKISEISVVLLTHAHKDAIGGLRDLDNWLKEPINVYSAPRVIAHKRLKKKFKNLNLKSIMPHKKFSITKNLKVTPFKVIHAEAFPTGPMFPCYGYRINNLVYAEDMEKIPTNSLKYFMNADIIIADAAMWFGRQIRGHMSTDQTLELAKQFHPNKLILMQAGHTYPSQKEAEKVIKEHWNKIKENIDTEIVLAYDGMELVQRKLMLTNLGPFELQRTGVSDVSGTSFPASPLGPVVIDKKKKKKEEELYVKKRGDEWCVLHSDGRIIKCFPKKEEADKMHKAIIISKIRRGKMQELEEVIEKKANLQILLDQFKSIILVHSFISLVGSTVKRQKEHKPNDIDLHIRMNDDIREYLERAINVRINKMLNEEIAKKIHLFTGDASGSHDTFLPVYHLALIPANEEIKEMSIDKLKLLNPYLPQKPKDSAYYKIKDILEALK